MPIIFVDHYTRKMIKENRDTIFVFGDNMIGSGLGGQAKEARGEPNVIGIPTKWFPNRDEGAYFQDIHAPGVVPKLVNVFAEIREHLTKGRNVVFPSAPIGSGRAELDTRAPKLYNKINVTVNNMVDKFGTLEPDVLKKP